MTEAEYSLKSQATGAFCGILIKWKYGVKMYKERRRWIELKVINKDIQTTKEKKKTSLKEDEERLENIDTEENEEKI